MIISIGVLAHNEASVIGETLASLLAQSIFAEDDRTVSSVEVIVLPNGCTDATAGMAERALSAAKPAASRPFAHSVISLDAADKGAAWNFFVHQASRGDADVLVLLDADIEFASANTVSDCLQILAEDSHVQVAVDTPLKHAVKEPDPNWRQRLSIYSSARAVSSAPAAICGQFYCGRSAALREIWMPAGLPVEDGYVLALVTTDGFRQQVDLSRVARAPSAAHYYHGEASLRGLIRHESRIIVGTAVNSYFLWNFLQFSTPKDGPPAGLVVRERLREDPTWFDQVVRSHIAARGAWVLPRGMLFRRFSPFQPRHLSDLPRQLVASLAGFALDAPAMLLANRVLKRGQGQHYW